MMLLRCQRGGIATYSVKIDIHQEKTQITRGGNNYVRSKYVLLSM